MAMSRVAFVAISMIIAVGVLLGFFMLREQSDDASAQGQSQETMSVLDLGITYLTVTDRSSARYGLEIDSGALVTEVASDSPAVKAGMKTGDVITSFNGAKLGEGTPLLEMMRTCGSRIVVQIWRKGSTETIELIPIY